jgi:hypothetical protein
LSGTRRVAITSAGKEFVVVAERRQGLTNNYANMGEPYCLLGFSMLHVQRDLVRLRESEQRIDQ